MNLDHGAEEEVGGIEEREIEEEVGVGMMDRTVDLLLVLMEEVVVGSNRLMEVAAEGQWEGVAGDTKINPLQVHHLVVHQYRGLI